MSTLDAKSLGLLEKDPGNPNRVSTTTVSARPTLSHSTTSVPTRPSLKETIAAQKRLAAQGIPARPESAQSIFSDTKPSATPKTSRPPAVAAATTQAIPTTLTAPVHNAKTLSSAPMRPPVRPPRRPEMTRPATADPYASRRVMNNGSHSKTNSPTETPLKTRPKTAFPAVPPSIPAASPVKQLKKPSPSTSPMKAKTKKPDPPRIKESEMRPMATPAMKANTMRLFDATANQASPTRANEDFTMVIPSVQTMSDIELPSTRRDSALSKDRLATIGKHSPMSSDGLSNVETLKVYEDPVPNTTGEVQSESHAIAGGFETPRAGTKVSALEELPVNEPATLPLRPRGFPTEFEAVSPLNGVGAHPSENSHRRWNKVETAEKRKSVSPRSKDPDQARLMLDNGITKIRARNLDVHGYRKLQGLIKEHDNIFKDETKFDDLLLALLDSLEAPNEERRTALGRPLDLKTQVLVTTRLMFAHNKLYFSAYYPRAMSAVISARKYYDSKDHIVSGLEETSEDIAGACNPGDVIDAILDVLETEERNEAGYRTISMGIYVLSGLLHRLNTRKMTMEKADLKRLGKLAFRSIRDTHPDIRRAVIDYCLELRDMVEPEEDFWQMINDSVEDYRALLTYYIIRRPSRV
jgi:CLIP-associating protein 1/2